MLKRAILFLVSAVLAAGLSVPAAAGSDVRPLFGLDEAGYDQIRDGVLTLVCTDPDTRSQFRSRAVLLDVPGLEGNYDILLATRHGVMRARGKMECHFPALSGRASRVMHIVAPPADPAEPSALTYDWAILQTARALPSDLPRLRPISLETGEWGEVSLLMRSFQTRPCALLDAPEAIEDQRLIFHGCPSRPGLSGAPMVAQIDGESYVVGIHLGDIMMLNENFRRYSVARRISDDFLEGLVGVIEKDSRD